MAARARTGTPLEPICVDRYVGLHASGSGNEGDLLGQEEEERTTSATSASGSADSVDVGLGLVGRVVLDLWAGAGRRQWMGGKTSAMREEDRIVPRAPGSAAVTGGQGAALTIQSTAGMSRPRAATSVDSRIPDDAEQNSKKVAVRLFCFWSPCNSRTGSAKQVGRRVGARGPASAARWVERRAAHRIA
eukprot:scaffold301866_cov26-Tisochrysis_lutea.AAC.3